MLYISEDDAEEQNVLEDADTIVKRCSVSQAQNQERNSDQHLHHKELEGETMGKQAKDQGEHNQNGRDMGKNRLREIETSQENLAALLLEVEKEAAKLKRSKKQKEQGKMPMEHKESNKDWKRGDDHDKGNQRQEVYEMQGDEAAMQVVAQGL